MKRQIKKKHHYIPKFHLNSWTNETGRLLSYRKIGSGKIESKMKYPSEVFFQNYLYTLNKERFEATGPRPDYVEDELAEIDDNAAKVLCKILDSSSVSGLTTEEKRHWASYVNSLLYRTPERIDDLEVMMKSIITETLDDIKTVATSETYDTWDICGKIFNEGTYGENDVRIRMLSVVRGNDWLTELLNYNWRVITVEEPSSLKFILTESPVVTFGGDNNISMLALALSPSLLWLAFPRALDDGEDFGEVFKYLVMVYNGVQLRRKPRFIISSVALSNDGLHNYDKILKDFLRPSIGVREGGLNYRHPAAS